MQLTFQPSSSAKQQQQQMRHQSPPPPPPPSHPKPAVKPGTTPLEPAALSDWLLDAEELISTCLTGIDVMLRLTAKHGVIPQPLLLDAKSRLVSNSSDNCVVMQLN